jgi:preprotein translocase subunit SecG
MMLFNLVLFLVLVLILAVISGADSESVVIQRALSMGVVVFPGIASIVTFAFIWGLPEVKAFVGRNWGKDVALKTRVAMILVVFFVFVVVVVTWFFTYLYAIYITTLSESAPEITARIKTRTKNKTRLKSIINLLLITSSLSQSKMN